MACGCARLRALTISEAAVQVADGDRSELGVFIRRRLNRCPQSNTQPEGSRSNKPLKVFVHGLRDLGWIEGRTVVIERWSAEGQPQRAPAISAEATSRVGEIVKPAGCSLKDRDLNSQ
jgi:hypothetical protein